MENSIELQSIRKKADEVLIEFDMYKKAPVDVLRICKTNLIKVQLVVFKDENIRAVINKSEKEEEYSYEIFLNHKLSPFEQRISIAHELGHYYMHREKLDKEMIVDVYKKAYSKSEIEADYFAKCLLLEENSVEMLWDKISDKNDVATIFKVTLNFLGERLKDLNLVDEQVGN